MNKEIIRYRLKFIKTDKMRYIGHLDLLKYFQRAVKRAEIPISFSQGFNPHQQMSFSMPLPLGMSGLSESVDIRLEHAVDCEELKERLNRQMSSGMEITDVRKLGENEDSGAALLAAADYTVTLDRKIEDLEEKLTETALDAEWLTEKTGKKNKTRTVDIKPLVYELSSQNDITVHAKIATGSNANLKIDLLMKYLYDKMGLEFDYLKLKVTRTELYKREENGEFTPL